MPFRSHPGSGIILLILLLLVAFGASVALGVAEISPRAIYTAYAAYDGSTAHLIIRTVRVPRAVIAAAVGAALAVAGAIMQVLTRNPLAAPRLLGVNAGAALAVVVALFLYKSSSLAVYAWAAFLGAALAAALVYLLGSVGRGGVTPLKLTLAGAALTALFMSVTQGVLILNERALDEIRFWLAGSVAGRDARLLLQVLPYMAAGLLVALLLGRPLTTLSLGEDVARGLGQQTGRVKAAAAVAVVLLSGSAVAVAGPIGFVGLAVPHLARALVGTDYRWILPYAALLGGVLLMAADIGARLIIKPQELPVGAVTALVGAPFLIQLARQGVRRI